MASNDVVDAWQDGTVRRSRRKRTSKPRQSRLPLSVLVDTGNGLVPGEVIATHAVTLREEGSNRCVDAIRVHVWLDDGSGDHRAAGCGREAVIYHVPPAEAARLYRARGKR